MDQGGLEEYREVVAQYKMRTRWQPRADDDGDIYGTM